MKKAVTFKSASGKKMKRILSLGLVLTVLGSAAWAQAKNGPPAKRAERDLRAKLDKKWVQQAEKVTIKQVGDWKTRDGYLRRRDLHKTTFFGHAFEVGYEYKDGRRKACGMQIVYYRKKGKWKLEKLTETSECKWAAGKGQEAPDGDKLVALVKPAIDDFLRKKHSSQYPYYSSADIKNLKVQQKLFKTYKSRFWYKFAGEYDVGDHHCASPKEIFTIKKENLDSDWVVTVAWPHCVPK